MFDSFLCAIYILRSTILSSRLIKIFPLPPSAFNKRHLRSTLAVHCWINRLIFDSFHHFRNSGTILLFPRVKYILRLTGYRQIGVHARVEPTIHHVSARRFDTWWIASRRAAPRRVASPLFASRVNILASVTLSRLLTTMRGKTNRFPNARRYIRCETWPCVWCISLSLTCYEKKLHLKEYVRGCSQDGNAERKKSLCNFAFTSFWLSVCAILHGTST